MSWKISSTEGCRWYRSTAASAALSTMRATQATCSLVSHNATAKPTETGVDMLPPAKPTVIAKFHYTGPTGPARTLSETRTGPRSFAAKKSVQVRAGPVGSGRVRVVEFSYNQTNVAAVRTAKGRIAGGIAPTTNPRYLERSGPQPSRLHISLFSSRPRAGCKCVEALGRIIIRGLSNAIIYMHLQL